MPQVKAVKVPLTKEEVEDLIHYAINTDNTGLESRLRRALSQLIRSELDEKPQTQATA